MPIGALTLLVNSEENRLLQGTPAEPAPSSRLCVLQTCTLLLPRGGTLLLQCDGAHFAGVKSAFLAPSTIRDAPAWIIEPCRSWWGEG